MRENLRPYLLISLGFHLCLIVMFMFIRGPQVVEVLPRRVKIEFISQRQRIPVEPTVETSRLPELEAQQLAESLQMQGPKTLAVPGTRASSAKPTGTSGGRRSSYERTQQPLLPEVSTPAAAPLLPPELLAEQVDAPDPAPAEESGITETGALEWKGRERQLLKSAALAFPDILLEQGLEVDVLAVFSVAANGQVIAVEIERSSGYASVDSAVQRALLGYLFEPADNSGEDVGQIQFRFRLERSD